jgi:ATP-dependent RNA circularization protein (DNA/RNA ligase family)
MEYKMKEYHKIQTVFKRAPDNNHKTLLEGDFSLPEFEYLQNNVWVFTEKVDGINIRVMYDGKEIAFSGKTDNAQIPAFLVKKLQEYFLPQAHKFTEKFGGDPIDVCLYGEGYGAKIKKGGGNYRPDQDFVLFDVKIGDWWLKREDVEDIAKFFGLEIVPIIGEGTLTEMVEQTRKGFNSIWGNFLAEGIVARPKVELITRGGARLITKIKHKDFRSA